MRLVIYPKYTSHISITKHCLGSIVLCLLIVIVNKLDFFPLLTYIGPKMACLIRSLIFVEIIIIFMSTKLNSKQAFYGLNQQIGGFGLPFYVIGSLILVTGAVIYFFLPEYTGKKSFNVKLII